MDSNHRSNLQQIYSLSPLATRESVHAFFIDQLSIPRFSGKCKDFFHFVIFATNSLGFTVSSAQAGPESASYRIPCQILYSTRRNSKKALFPREKNFLRKRACKRARNSLSPNFRKHVNTDLPHFFTVRAKRPPGRSAGRPDKRRHPLYPAPFRCSHRALDHCSVYRSRKSSGPRTRISYRQGSFLS